MPIDTKYKSTSTGFNSINYSDILYNENTKETARFIKHIQSGNILLQREIKPNALYKKGYIYTVLPDSDILYNKKTKEIDFYDYHDSGYPPQGLDTVQLFLANNLKEIETGGAGGKDLLKSINDALNNDRKLTIRFRKGGGDEYKNRSQLDENKHLIVDNIVYVDISKDFAKAKIRNSEIESFNSKNSRGIIGSKSVINARTGNINLANIERERSPFYVRLAHELNHFKHQIDNSNKGGIRAVTETESDYSRVFQVGDIMSIWDKAEERRNVFSPIDSSSELNIRTERGLHIKYPYTSKSKFVEPVKTIIRSAIRSEKPIENTTLRIADSREWLGKLKGLVDKLDKLPKTRVSNSKLGVLHRADTVDTNDSNSMQYTKIKLLPYLFGEDVYPFPTEQKQQIVESYTQHMRDKGKKTPWISFFDRFSNNKTEKRFNKMMSDIKSEQDRKILRDSIEQERNGLEKYSFIPRMLAREIGKGNVEVKNINRIKDEEALTDTFTKQLRAIVNQRSPSAHASPRNPQPRDKSWRRYSQ